MMMMETLGHGDSQQMDQIEILWKQDVDLGAGREVFDVALRRKELEHELFKKRENERLEQVAFEEEKARLACFEVDGETGEYVPVQRGGNPLPKLEEESALTRGVKESAIPGGEQAPLSFDECLKILEENFNFDTTPEVPALPDVTGPIAMGEPVPCVPVLAPDKVAVPPAQCQPLDLEQRWQEILSLPDFQVLDMHVVDLEPSLYAGIESQPALDVLESCPALCCDSTATAVPAQDFNSTYDAMGSNLPNAENSCPAFYSIEQVSTSHIYPPFDSGMLLPSIPSTYAPVSNAAAQASNNLADSELNELLGSTVLTSLGSVEVPIDSEANYCGMDLPESKYGIVKVTAGNSRLPLNLPPRESIPGCSDVGKIEIFRPSSSFLAFESTAALDEHDSDSGMSTGSSPHGSHDSHYHQALFRDEDDEFSDEDDLDEMESLNGERHTYSQEGDGSAFLDEAHYNSSSPGNDEKQRRNPSGKRSKLSRSDPAAMDGSVKRPVARDKSGCYPTSKGGGRMSRDERKAHSLKIPFSVADIVNLPVDDFVGLLSRHQLNDSQLALVRDIRRRGKNKVAAQNCRKRKMEGLSSLEGELDGLLGERERLKRERDQLSSGLASVRQGLEQMQRQVFESLRDDAGQPYSPSKYFLEYASNGTIFLVPRHPSHVVRPVEALRVQK
ncbi:nuclear factor erythroid 2-related factor 2-like [Lampetra planeri]